MTTAENKTCIDCGSILDLSGLNLTKWHRHRTRCKACEKIRRDHWKSTYKERNHDPRGTKGRKTWDCISNCGNRVKRNPSRCWTCYSKSRQSGLIPKKIVVKEKIKPQYPCLGNCGMLMSKPDTRCIPCKRSRQVMIAANAEHKAKKSRVTNSFANGSTFGMMFIGEEVFSLSSECSEPTCKKPVLVKSKCYSCATGKPISLLVLPRIVYK